MYLNDVELVISTRDISAQLAGRRFTESKRARCRATLNSRTIVCRSRIMLVLESAMTENVAMIARTTNTIINSTNENPFWFLEMGMIMGFAPSNDGEA